MSFLAILCSFSMKCLDKFSATFVSKWFIVYGSPPLICGDMFQDPLWMPETEDSTEPYAYCVFPIYEYL